MALPVNRLLAQGLGVSALLFLVLTANARAAPISSQTGVIYKK